MRHWHNIDDITNRNEKMLIFANLSIFFLYKIEAIPRTIATAYKLMEPHLESKHLSGGKTASTWEPAPTS